MTISSTGGSPGYTLGENGPNGSGKYKFENGKWVFTGEESSSAPIQQGYTCPSPVSTGGSIPSGTEGQTVWVHAVAE